jgi:hypothetical protein
VIRKRVVHNVASLFDALGPAQESQDLTRTDLYDDNINRAGTTLCGFCLRTPNRSLLNKRNACFFHAFAVNFCINNFSVGDFQYGGCVSSMDVTKNQKLDDQWGVRP